MLELYNSGLHAFQRIREYIKQTPLELSIPLSKMTRANVYLKYENLQYTGSFKVRGAFNCLLSLTAEQKQQGIVVASSGNHGAAMALALSTMEIPGIIFVPKNASKTKVENIHNYDIPLEFYETDTGKTELHAINYAKKHHMTYVSPYNNKYVIQGQATIGVELTQQLDKIDVILVAVGGGGLISGIAGYIKQVSPNTKIIGCLPKHSPVMAESIKARKIIDIHTLPTLSDATAGGIEPEAMTFPLCQTWVDDWQLVSEEDIKNAIISLIKTQHLLIEGAAGVALATLFKREQQFEGKNVVIILSGGNISLDTLKSII